MKKVFILIILFAMPVSVYIFFASAAHNFAHLPTRTKDVDTLENFTSLRGDTLQFKDHVSVVCIFGKSIDDKQGNAFNLNDKIYKKNHIYKDFQFIVLAEDGTQDQAKELIEKLHKFTGLDMSKWKFAFGPEKAIRAIFRSFESDLSLDREFSTPYAFIVDKDRNLRGQKDDQPKTTKTLYGYDSRSIAALNNTMVDDVKILLAEYRLALKRNDNKISNKTLKQ